MDNLQEIKDRVMELFDREVATLSKTDYREVLEETISGLEARLECVKEEMDADGED